LWDEDDQERVGGVAGDVFLHMVDAWAEARLGTLSAAKVDAAIRKLDEFTDAMGDRFENAADLERAIADWTLSVGPRKAKACVILTDTIAVWKAIESEERESRSDPSIPPHDVHPAATRTTRPS
jgi:hypothetical protein